MPFKQSLREICLTTGLLYKTEETATPRRRSLRKSLRESFRHLRKRRIPISLLHRRTRTESKTAASAEADTAKPAEEGKTDQPASSSAAALVEIFLYLFVIATSSLPAMSHVVSVHVLPV